MNGNLLWDEGETFLDGNGNGLHDAEAYDPLTTGYIADPNASNVFAPGGDLELEITLHPGAPGDAPTPGQYYAISLPAVNRGTPIPSNYRDDFSNCGPALVGPGDRCQVQAGSMLGPTNQIMRDLIAQDAGAFWDPASRQVAGSAFGPGESPRMLRFPVHDPRVPLTSAYSSLVTTKVIAFFMERMPGSAMVQGRFLRTTGDGEVCPAGTPIAGWVVACATPATSMTWGRMKGIYR
jgi:hypothetical protein